MFIVRPRKSAGQNDLIVNILFIHNFVKIIFNISPPTFSLSIYIFYFFSFS